MVAATKSDGFARKMFDAKVAYLRISTENEMVLNRATIEEMLGRPFSMNELEVELSSFAGRIESQAEKVRFYYTKQI